ncbi:MAG: clostripain-related cysteine peptidase [Tannerellaceae bacterium]|nr:clostripain-related cysteine peptidase [Tannerellaceae bacterium]
MKKTYRKLVTLPPENTKNEYMFKLLKALFIWVFFLSFCTGCDKEEIPTVEPPVVEPPVIPPTGTTAERAVLVYFMADNSLQSFAKADLQELEKGLTDFDDSNSYLLVYMDDGGDAELFRLMKNSDGEVIKGEIKTYPSQDSADPEVMKEVFSEVFTNYKANDYGLVLWSHGEGWIESPTTRWFGQDGNNFMNISELKEVLETAPHFEYIYFDACYMAAVEVLYELRSFADYFIASPMETPGPGVPYDLILPDMFGKTEPAIQIANTYYEHYNEKYQAGVGLTNNNWTAGASITVIKSDALEGLANTTRSIFPHYVPEEEYIDRSNLLCYDTRSSRYYYDMDGLMQNLINKNEEYSEWKLAYDRAVVYYKTTQLNYSMHIYGMFNMDGSTGMSSYIPRANQASILPYFRTYEWYQAGGWQDAGY